MSALVDLEVLGLQAAGQQILDRLDHRIRHAQMHLAADLAQLDGEGDCHDHFVGRGDVGELGVHLRADEFEFDRVDRLPGFRVGLEHDVEHALDDAVFGLGEITAFDPGVEAPVAAEQIVHHQENQVGIEDHQRSAAQRLELHQVEVSGHHQVADELAVLRYPYRADRNLDPAPQEVVEADSQLAGEALVDDFERRHAAAHDAFLRGQVVGANRRGIVRFGRRLVDFAGHAFQQRVDFILREKIVGHGGFTGSRRK